MGFMAPTCITLFDKSKVNSLNTPRRMKQTLSPDPVEYGNALSCKNKQIISKLRSTQKFC